MNILSENKRDNKVQVSLELSEKEWREMQFHMMREFCCEDFFMPRGYKPKGGDKFIYNPYQGWQLWPYEKEQ